MLENYIKKAVKDLATTYSEIPDLLHTAVASSNVDYSFALNALDRAIKHFKAEMRALVPEYNKLAKANKINQQIFAKHINMEVKKLHEAWGVATKVVPDKEFKKYLGSNYEFHKKVSKLTSSNIMTYFETNFALQDESLTDK